MKTWIDLRSDTVTRPTAPMREAMSQAPVGDDVFAEDPTVNQLESRMAELLDLESSLFVSSGTQANLLAILSHCERGDEYIAGQEFHIYRWEGGGAAVLGSVQPQPILIEKDGTLSFQAIKKAIKPDDFHHAKTRLLCLENTFAGKILPLSYLDEVAAFAQQHQLKLHLDGARAWNAAVALQIPLRRITHPFDTISLCFSKGLGAPVGSILCGTRETIEKARRWRKVLGGGMRQAGILAAAALYAIENHVERLVEDHENAIHLAKVLAEMTEVSVDLSQVHSNMVFIQLASSLNPLLIRDLMKEKGILIFPGQTMRWVTHLDISRKDVDTILKSFQWAVSQSS
jgi:threonine aldolase